MISMDFKARLNSCADAGWVGRGGADSGSGPGTWWLFCFESGGVTTQAASKVPMSLFFLFLCFFLLFVLLFVIIISPNIHLLKAPCEVFRYLTFCHNKRDQIRFVYNVRCSYARSGFLMAGVSSLINSQHLGIGAPVRFHKPHLLMWLFVSF